MVVVGHQHSPTPHGRCPDTKGRETTFLQAFHSHQPLASELSQRAKARLPSAHQTTLVWRFDVVAVVARTSPPPRGRIAIQARLGSPPQLSVSLRFTCSSCSSVMANDYWLGLGEEGGRGLRRANGEDSDEGLFIGGRIITRKGGDGEN